MRKGPANVGVPAPTTHGREPETSKCKPSCCKSPFGHAIGRDHLPAWHKDACHCHNEPKTKTANEAMRDIFAEAAALRDKESER